MAIQPQTFPNKLLDSDRPMFNFPPSVWGFSFASFVSQNGESESLEKKVWELKEEVGKMLIASTRDPIENIEFINLLCRLGVSYHFESEIEEQLNHIFNGLPFLLENNNLDLYTLSLLFRVLRQHGLKMPCDAFNKFKENGNGKFKKDMMGDVKGMLSLYEACHLSVHGEEILDEALNFTTQNLESMAMKSSPSLSKHIKEALTLPFHKGITRLEARRFISFYQEEKFPNETLLIFAKLDFNRVQLLHQQELVTLSKWWKDLNLVGELPYARDRIVELYLWAVGTHFEPHYALSRQVLTKVAAMTSLLDDTYDAYGTRHELQAFTRAFEGWNIACTDQLPDYMKVLYNTILNLLQEVEDIVTKQGRPYAAYYGKEAFKELVRSYDQEAKWFNEGYVPPFDEYMKNGLGTSTYGLFPVASFIGMETATSTEYEWLKSNPKIANALKIIGRLENDIATYEDEQKRGDCASGVECYMKKYNVSEEESIRELVKMCANGWKDANEELLMKPTSVSMSHLKVLLNLMRVTEVFYKHNDAYTKAWTLKHEIASLFVEKVSI